MTTSNLSARSSNEPISFQAAVEPTNQEPTTKPIVSLGPSISPQPTIEPTYAFSSSLNAILFVSGICNGCENSIIWTNQINGRARLLGGEDSQPHNWSPRRFLEEEQAESSCFCPISAIVQDVALLANDVEQQFQSELSRSSIPLGVKKLDEVEVVECDTATKPFSSELTLGLSITSDISGNILDSVAALVEYVYNELIEDYCDPLIRRIQSLKISNYEPSELVGCQNVQLTFGVDGECRGCDDDVSRLDQENNDEKTKKRVMQSTSSFHEEPSIESHRRG